MKFNTSLFVKGMLMGIAEIIPGVSGGTLAFITGIYTCLLYTSPSPRDRTRSRMPSSA